MTGRPPSKGCLPCKKRRKRCDLLQPVCTRCVKLRSECQYAPQTWRFIDTTSTKEAHALVPVASRTNAKQRTSLTNDGYVFSKAAIISQVASTFWNQYLPAQLLEKKADLAATPHLLSYRQMASRDSTLQCALDAVALLCVGQQHDDTALVYKGSCLYVEAISALNNALRQPARATSDTVLASCRVIALYEMFRPAQQNDQQRDDWVKHVWGLSSIVALRRQAIGRDSLSTRMNDDARALAGHCALRMRSPAVLTNFGSSLDATLHNSITDCMALVAAWLEQHDRLIDDIECKGHGAAAATLNDDFAQLLTQGLKVLQALHKWEDFALEFCGVPIKFEHDAMPDKRCIALLDAAHTAGHRVWFVVMQYWSSCVVMCSQLHFTRHYFQLLGRCELPQLPVFVSAAPYARCIAASAPSLLATDAGLWTLEQILLPLASAVCYYAAMDAGTSWEARQMQQAFSCCKNSVFVRGFLRDVKNYDVEEDIETRQQIMRLKTAKAREWYHLPIDWADIWLP